MAEHVEFKPQLKKLDEAGTEGEEKAAGAEEDAEQPGEEKEAASFSRKKREQ